MDFYSILSFKTLPAATAHKPQTANSPPNRTHERSGGSGAVSLAGSALVSLVGVGYPAVRPCGNDIKRVRRRAASRQGRAARETSAACSGTWFLANTRSPDSVSARYVSTLAPASCGTWSAAGAGNITGTMPPHGHVVAGLPLASRWECCWCLGSCYLYKFLGLNFCPASEWVRSGYGHGTTDGVLDTVVWPESLSFDERGMPPVPVRWTGVCQGGERFHVSNCNRKLPAKPSHTGD
ncbi:subtilisin-like protease SBT1.2 [Panicum miliaceum]|uniref:Subtilisin-like protease SBT1.2 n=1 Tax=Panicum miliaceum TaxID=4540 RepID=A0A3L6QSD4_PANMI|nr:subtilisin-like protease SBT1.2 [Panicum miliaceum]